MKGGDGVVGERNRAGNRNRDRDRDSTEHFSPTFPLNSLFRALLYYLKSRGVRYFSLFKSLRAGVSMQLAA